MIFPIKCKYTTNAAPCAAAARDPTIIKMQSNPSAQAKSLKKGTAAGGGSISSVSSTPPSSSTCMASVVDSKYGDGDSGGSDTSETGVKGCMWGGDQPKRPLEIIIVKSENLNCSTATEENHNSLLRPAERCTETDPSPQLNRPTLSSKPVSTVKQTLQDHLTYNAPWPR